MCISTYMYGLCMCVCVCMYIQYMCTVHALYMSVEGHIYLYNGCGICMYNIHIAVCWVYMYVHVHVYVYMRRTHITMEHVYVCDI